MTHTTKISLPYLQAAQAQKHVTLNESLSILDVVVQPTVLSVLSAPPESPNEGDSYIVGASATGVWASRETYITFYLNGSWEFILPNEGWSFYVGSNATVYRFDGTQWQTTKPATLESVVGTAYTPITTGWEYVPFANVTLNVGATFDGVEFTAQRSGLYCVETTVVCGGGTNPEELVQCGVSVDNTDPTNDKIFPVVLTTGVNTAMSMGTTYVQLTAGQTVGVKTIVAGVSGAFQANQSRFIVREML